MPRKKKQENLKAVQSMVTLPRSFHRYLCTHDTVSKTVQNMIAREITGLTYLEFFGRFYSDYVSLGERSHPEDTLEQEYLRVARWILESRIDWCEFIPESNSVVLKIKWIANNTYSKVEVLLGNKGYKHVIYDTYQDMNPNDIKRGSWDGIEEYEAVKNGTGCYEDTGEFTHRSIAIMPEVEGLEDLEKCLELSDLEGDAYRTASHKIQLLGQWFEHQQLSDGAEVL